MMARLEGLEPPAHGLEGRCSIQLSYRRMPQDGFLRRKIGAFRGNLPFPLTGMHYITGLCLCQPIFHLCALTKQLMKDMLCGCEVNRRSQAFGHEESPGTTGQGCRLTAGGGDSRESATERNRRLRAVRMERRGKSSPGSRVTGFRCKPHPVQDAMEA